MLEEIDLELNEEEDIRTENSWEDHWRYIVKNGKDKSNIHALRWDV